MSEKAVLTLDGETVTFDGPVPETPRACLELLVTALQQQGRVLVAFRMDGANVDEAPERFDKAGWTTIEAVSRSREEYLQEVSREAALRIPRCAEVARTLSDRCLLESWSQVLPAVSPMLEELTPILEAAEQLEALEDPVLSENFHIAREGIEAMVAAAEQTDIAVVSECLRTRLADPLEAVSQRLELLSPEKP